MFKKYRLRLTQELHYNFGFQLPVEVNSWPYTQPPWENVVNLYSVSERI